MVTVTAAIIKQDDAILIVQRKAGKSFGGYWEFPGGKIEDGETPEECLVRELSEELGVVAFVLHPFAENTYIHANGVIRLLAFVATIEDLSVLKLVDHDDIKWVTPETILSYRLAPADVAIAEEIVESFHEI